MKRILPSLVCGFGASVLTTIPGFKDFGCCLIIPTATYFALFLDMKINHSYEMIRPSKAVTFGLLTGIFATFFSTGFEILITYLLKTNDFVASLPQFNTTFKNYFQGPAFEQGLASLKKLEQEIVTNGFSPIYLISFFSINIVVNTIFGIAGGLFGMYFINKRYNSQQP